MGTPLKVTIVMQSRLQKHGSFEDFVVFLARKARQLGWNLSFVFPKIITQQVRFQLEEQGAAVYEVDAVWDSWSGSWEVTKLLWKIGPDIVNLHFCTGMSFLLPCISCLAAGSSVAFHYHGETVPLERLRWKNRHVSRLRFLTLFVTRIVAGSRANLEFLRALNVGRPIDMVYYGIDVDLFERYAVPERSTTVMSKDAQLLKVIYIGSLIPRKCVEVLIQAFALVHKELPQARLTVVGGGSREAECRELVRNLNLTECVSFAGLLSEYPYELLAESDLFASASESESFGLVFAEALSLGVPVVACRVGGIPEVVADGETGLLVPVNDPVAMSSAICTLLRDDELRRKMRRVSPKRVRNMFNLNEKIDELCQVFEAMR